MNQTGIPSTSFGHSYNVQPTSSSEQNGVAGPRVNATSRKAARAAQEGRVAHEGRAAQEGGVSAPTPMNLDSGVQVRQHTDAMAIIELPPAYRDTLPH